MILSLSMSVLKFIAFLSNLMCIISIINRLSR